MDYLISTISFVAAFIFSLGGVGAAIILIPILVSFGIPIGVAKPVGLFYNTVSLVGASVSNIRNKRLDFKIGLPIIIFSFLFAILGAWVSQYNPKKIILILFTGLLLFSGIMFLFHKKNGQDLYRDDRTYGALSGIGAFAGFLSGLLGMGGGTISRLATRKVPEELKFVETVTLCLPLYLAGYEEERNVAKVFPTISVDGCDKLCAKRSTEKYSGKVNGFIDVSKINGNENAFNTKIARNKDLKDEHLQMVYEVAREIVKKISGISPDSWTGKSFGGCGCVS